MRIVLRLFGDRLQFLCIGVGCQREAALA